MRTISSLLLFTGLVITALVLPASAHAFLATGTTMIIASAAAPFVGAALVVLVVNVIVFYKRIPKKVLIGVVVVISLLVLGEIGRQAYTRFTDLRTSNEIGANFEIEQIDDERWQNFVDDALEEEEGIGGGNPEGSWDEFVQEVNLSEEGDTHRRILYRDGDYCVNRNATQVTRLKDEEIEDIIINEKRKILDVSCPSITVKNGTKACGFSWQIFQNFEDEEFVTNELAKYGIEEGDEILLLCEFGVTTSHLSFILNHYGYDSMYGALVDLDEDLLDIPKDTSFEDYTVLIDVFSYDPRDEYLYFFINDRDRDLFYEENPTNYARLLDDFTLINASGLPIEYDQDVPLRPKTQPAEAVQDLDVSDYKIVCKNKYHCFLTRHFLYYNDIKDVESLYCVSCKDERTVPYCQD